MNRNEKIKILKGVEAGKIKLEQLKEPNRYIFQLDKETGMYKDWFTGKTMSLVEINELPCAPGPTGRLEGGMFDEEGNWIPSDITINTY